MVKKLKYLLFLIPLLFIQNVNAQNYTLSFNTLRSTSQNLDNSFQCNNNLCVVYGAEFLNIPFSFEWGTSGSPTCSSTAVVSGKIHTDNVNFGINNNDYSYNKVYLINDNVQSNCSFQVGDSTTDFVCTSSSLSSNFKIGFTLNPTFGGDSTLNTLIYRSIDINCDTSTGQIIENNNQNTQNIINNNTTNTNQIIQDNQQNTQDIINNQNSNTQQQIESQKVCKTIIIDKKYAYEQNKAISNTGEVVDSISGNGITDYLDITNVTNIKNLSTTGAGTNYYFCTYNSNKVKVNCYNRTSYVNQTISISTNERYVRFSLNIPTDRPQFEYIQCQNGNQALSDSITSDDAPNTDNNISEMNDMVASDTPISDLITMPLTLFRAYINGVNANCSPYNFGNLYGTDLIFPCINLEQRLGSNLWRIIDALFSLFLCYNIGMLFISAFDGLTSLRDDFEGLYQPRHADTGYKPKHGG